ncbi:MAG: adenylate/guanylate cyclase domain-containing protein [Bacteroidota bacterium]
MCWSKHKHVLKTLILLLLGAWGGTSYSQGVDTLFLKKRLTEATPDSQRLSALTSLAGLFARNQPVRAQGYAEEAYQLAEDGNNWQSMARSSMVLGDIQWNQGHYRIALNHYSLALELFESNDRPVGTASSLFNLARVEYRFGNYPKALDLHLQALEIREALNLRKPIAESYFGVGVVQAEAGAYDDALVNYEKALEISKELKEKRLTADILNYIGRAWRKKREYDHAMTAHRESRAIYLELGDDLGMSDYFNNVGSIYRRRDMYHLALDHFFQSLAIQKRLNDQEGLADGYNDIGTTYMQMAVYDSAEYFLLQALGIARKLGLRDDVRYAYASLAKTYEATRDYAKALEAFQAYDAIKDSLINQDKLNQMADLEFRKEREERQKQMEYLETQAQLDRINQQQNTIYLIIGLGVLVLIAIGLMYRSRLQSRVNRKLATKNRIIDIEKKKADDLLLNILPESVAEELKQHGKARVRAYEEVSVMFIDFKGFTNMAEIMSPRELVRELDECFRAFDDIIEKHGLEKIKTIGDAYMCACGLPDLRPTHATDAVRAGLAIQSYMHEARLRKENDNLPFFECRVGIHTGPVVAGVVGSKKFAYDIWGDTVNTAARIEHGGAVGLVNISQSTFEQIQQDFICEYRGKVEAKNKGQIDMYFVKWEV